MAKITQYQQGQLASGVVGTPFEHLNSMAAMAPADATENFGRQVGDLAGGLYRQDQARQLAAQKQAQAAQKHLDDLARETQSTTIATNAEADAHKDMNDVQLQFRDNPQEGVSQYNAMAQGRIGSTVQQVTQQHPNDPELPMMVQKALETNHSARMNTMGSWANSMQIPNMKKNLDESGGALSSQLSNMGGQPIQGAIDAVKTWAGQTQDQFHQIDPKGIAGQQPHIDDAIKQRLLAGALKGDPKASEAEVEEVRKSGIMTPAALFGVKSEVAAQAAHQAAVNAQALAGTQSSTLLNVYQKLTDPAGGGNGNIENNNPAYNNKILRDNAANLKPDHLMALTEKLGMGQSKVEAAQSKSQFESEVAAQSPNGDISKASPQVIQAGLAKYGKSMTPEERAQYEPLVSKSQARLDQANENNIISADIGQHIQGLNNLHTRILQQQVAVGALTNDPVQHAKALNDLQTSVQNFAQSYQGLVTMRNSLKDPSMKGVLEMEMGHTNTQMKQLQDSLSVMGDPVRTKQIQSHKQLYDDLYSKVGPSHTYSDPKIQATYNYWHTREYYSVIEQRGFTDAQLTQIKNNPIQSAKMKADIDRRTQHALASLKLIPQ
jgi:hypothetical protein